MKLAAAARRWPLPDATSRQARARPAAITSAPLAAASAPAAVIADAGADTDAAAPEARKPREIHGKLLCFGDSITQAEWDGKIAPEERWVTQLGKKSPDITVVNAGKNGRKTSALDELGKALDGNADAAMVLIFLGVNDMKHETVGVVEKATNNIGKMIDLTRAKLPKAEIVILAPINVNVEKLTPFFKAEAWGRTPLTSCAGSRGLTRSWRRRRDAVHQPLPRGDAGEPRGRRARQREGQIQIADAVWKGLQRR